MKRINFTILYFFVLWFVFTFWTILNYDKSFFSLSYGHPISSFSNFSKQKMFAGDKVSGSFTSRKDNLGTVSVNFSFGQRVAYKDEDKLIFRIKEKDSDTWYYENLYRSGMIYDSPMFPFGFPLIEKSEGKTYVFELISTKGNERNALSIEKSYPTLESRYIVSRDSIKESPIGLVAFLLTKFLSKISNLEIVFVSFVLILPLIVYSLWIVIFFRLFEKSIRRQIMAKKALKSFEQLYPRSYSLVQESYLVILGFVLILLVLTDSLMIHARTNLIYLIVILMWFRAFKNNFRSDFISGVFALIFLILTPVLLEMGYYESALKTSAWSLIFFLCSLIFILVRRKFDT